MLTSFWKQTCKSLPLLLLKCTLPCQKKKEATSGSTFGGLGAVVEAAGILGTNLFSVKLIQVCHQSQFYASNPLAHHSSLALQAVLSGSTGCYQSPHLTKEPLSSIIPCQDRVH